MAKDLIDRTSVFNLSEEEQKKGFIEAICQELAYEKLVALSPENELLYRNKLHQARNDVCRYSAALQLSGSTTYVQEVMRTQRINETPTETYSSSTRKVVRDDEWWENEFRDMGAIE